MSKEFGWIKSIYEKTSGYIHLSNEHIFDSFKTNKSNSDLKLSITITDKDEDVNIQTKIDAVNTMCHITELLLKYLHGWTWTKDNPNKIEQMKRERLSR